MSGAGRVWIRHFSTMLIVVFILAVALIGYQRTRRDVNGVGSVDPGDVGFDPTDLAVGLYKGFRHTETMNGKPIFILNSLKTLSLASGWQEIEGVRLQFFREGEEGPVLTAERANYNIETKEARLEGGIHVEFPNGAFLNTQAGRFQAKSQVFVSEGPVVYVDGATFGQAEEASYNLATDQVKLDGKAALRSEDGTMLVAPRMIYLRDERIVRFPDGVELNQDLTALTAPRGTVTLGSDDGPPERIELRGGVDFTGTVVSTGALVKMWAQRMTAQRDPMGQWQLSARTDGPWVEVRFIGGPDYFERTLRTTNLGAVVGEHGIISMMSRHTVCLEEIPLEGPPRSAQSESARAWFNDGQVTDVELDGHVEIRASDVHASGTRARLVQSNGMVMLQGDPTGRSRVELASDRGQMSCDQAVLFDREDRIEARGQVHGELRNARLLGNETGVDGDEPVRFAGELLEVEDDGKLYSLRDNGRIWQGHQLLFADDIIFNNESQAVTARGHVRATFPANQIDAAAAPEDDVVVVARSLDYDSLGGSAVFRGSVHYSDPKHALSANKLSLEFDDDNEITDVEAEGAVEIKDLVMGRRLTGKHAIREVESQVITVTGAPAQLTDERGNVASGESLTWNQADGTVSIGGGTELIYYPEETSEPESAGPRRE